MATQAWGTPETAITSISGGFNSLASGSRVNATSTSGVQTSGVIPNGTDKYTHMAAELYLTHASAVFASTPASGAFFALYAVPAGLSSGNTVDGLSVAPTSDLLIGTLAVRAAAATAVRVGNYNMEIPPFDFTLVVGNNLGVALSNSLTNAILSARRYNLTVA